MLGRMNHYLLRGLASGPVVMRRLYALIPAARRDEPTHEGRFSPRQVVAHMADWEPIFHDRLQLAISQPGSTITVYDEGERAVQLGYAACDADERLVCFARDRARTVEIIQNATAEQLRHPFNHPEHGVMAVDDLACMILGHDTYHFDQLSSVLVP